MENKIEKIIEKVWDFFCSMKMGLALLLLVALASGIGTVIPQQFMDPEGARAVAEIWRALEFTNVYSSACFRLILGLLCINLIFCNMRSFKRIYKLTFMPKPPEECANVPKKISAVVTGTDAEGLRQKTQYILKKKGFNITQLEKEDNWRFTAQKYAIGHWGSFITHVAILILILGALIGSLFGFKGYMIAHDGSSTLVGDIAISKGEIKENFEVQVHSVEDRMLPNGERDNWYTDLSIIEGDREVLRDTLFVNHPVTYKGVSFYQSGYAPGALFTVDIKGQAFTAALQNKGGNFYNIPGTIYDLVLVAIQKDAQETYVFYQIYDENSQIQNGRLTVGQSEDIQDAFTVTFDKLIGFTGLQVKADPGVGVVWLGCVLLMIGLMLSFYCCPIRIAGTLDLQPTPALCIGAYAGKLEAKTKKEFDQIVHEINV